MYLGMIQERAATDETILSVVHELPRLLPLTFKISIDAFSISTRNSSTYDDENQEKKTVSREQDLDSSTGEEEERPRRRFLCYELPFRSEVRAFTSKIGFGLISIIFWYIAAYLMLGAGLLRPWMGFLFSLGLLYLCAWIGSWIFKRLILLPSLLGALVAGFILRNINPIILTSLLDERPGLGSAIRSIALSIILIRAGLGMDVVAVIKKGLAVILLSFLPNIFEASMIAVVSWGTLGLPWSWAFLTGFVVCSLSSAVTAPVMVSLQEKKLGTDQGIPSLILAAASLDDVTAFAGFGVCLGLIFPQDESLVMTILHGPLEIVGGSITGLILGFIMLGLSMLYDSRALRLVSTVGGCLALVFGGAALSYSGAGALASIVTGIVINWKWNRNFSSILEEDLKVIWVYIQPLLFAFIGASVSLSFVTLDTFGYGLLSLICGLVIRILVVFVLSGVKTGYDWKEKLYVAVAFIPKAAVQAALAPIALDQARLKDQSQVSRGEIVLTIGILSIIIAAPIGAIAAKKLSRRLLKESVKTQPDP